MKLTYLQVANYNIIDFFNYIIVLINQLLFISEKINIFFYIILIIILISIANVIGIYKSAFCFASQYVPK